MLLSPSRASREKDFVDVFLCGDVMTGRGVDQALPHPGPPVLYEPHIHDARDYIRLAERANGPISHPVDFAHVWGEALEVLESADVRIVNLETSVTSSADAWPGKEIHYRMSPRNIECLSAARIDCCCLANNHALDWGYDGLRETLATLDGVGIVRSGAGENAGQAEAPAVVDLASKGRVLVFVTGSSSSGIPPAWAATHTGPGVNLLEDLGALDIGRLAPRIHELKQPGDIVVASIHWGSNWGYGIPAEQVRFARRLVEEGVDLVHGHSSHHVKAIEVYRDRLILYGCGDFVDDYEGISGYEEFRGDIRLAYSVTFDPLQGCLLGAQLTPLRIKRLRLERASPADANWLLDLLNRLRALFGTRVEMQPDSNLLLRWE